jgi:flagellin
MSLNAQRNLNRTAGSLATALQRLSSGLRVNSAKDDAAGLAISDRMTSQIRGMNQAARNASDAVSLAQTGEGALQEITNNLQRMRELSVQSRNATNTDSDRKSLDAEFQQLLSEVDRLAQTTSFNGRNVLDGTLGSSDFQVGANVGETVTVDVSSSMRTNAIGSFASATYVVNDVATQAGAAAASLGDDLSVGDGEIVVNGSNVTGVADQSAGRGDGSALQIAAAINAGQATHGVTATAVAASQTFTNAQVNNFAFTDNTTSADTLTYTLSINGQQITQQTEGAVTISNSQDLATAINNQSQNTGVSATVSQTGDITLTASDGRNIEVKEVIGGGGDATDQVVGYFGNTLVGSGAVGTEQAFTVYKGSVSLSASADFTVATDDGANVVIFNGIADGGSAVTSATTIDQSNILNTTTADASINRIDQAITDVDTLRGTFGAIQSRFESTVSSLQATSENVSAARSRIQDTDFAAETANLTRSQILQQAGLAMLAQANSGPQSVLALLQ